MYRDFVCFYGPDGTKIFVLVFVLIKSGNVDPLYIYNVHWSNQAGNDSYFYKDCLEHLLKETDLLDNVNILYISGDHGPHFIARNTM